MLFGVEVSGSAHGNKCVQQRDQRSAGERWRKARKHRANTIQLASAIVHKTVGIPGQTARGWGSSQQQMEGGGESKVVGVTGGVWGQSVRVHGD
jgi:hypothetical protein